VGLKNSNKIKDLWFYVYDEDIPFARVYSPSLKSADNSPKNCHSLQAEIFFANDSKKISPEEALQKTIQGLIKMGVIILEDIILTDIRFEKYANIIFDHNIYKNREIILKYLKKLDIKSIGRFGEWDYFWSDQAFISGKESAEELLTEIGC
jgi:protoporphyrinogen oxidase